MLPQRQIYRAQRKQHEVSFGSADPLRNRTFPSLLRSEIWFRQCVETCQYTTYTRPPYEPRDNRPLSHSAPAGMACPALLLAPQATQRARARWEEGQKSAMEKAAAEAVEEREKALEDARRVSTKANKKNLLLSVCREGGQSFVFLGASRYAVSHKCARQPARHKRTCESKLLEIVVPSVAATRVEGLRSCWIYIYIRNTQKDIHRRFSCTRRYEGPFPARKYLFPARL